MKTICPNCKKPRKLSQITLMSGVLGKNMTTLDKFCRECGKKLALLNKQVDLNAKK